jgi:C1A family cysteine protease
MPNQLHSLYATPSPALAHAENRAYGWHRSTRPTPHPRYAMPAPHAAGHLPASVDLTPECPPVYDQGSLGSCTANALAALFQFLLIKEGRPSFVPSRLMIYWGERAIEGTKDQDAGANGDDGVTFLQTKGVCPESNWPYDPSRFAEIPPPIAWAEATRHKIADPVAIDNANLDEIKSCLASGYPIAFGFVAYPDLEGEKVATTGMLPMPAKGEASIGGHEVLIVGYDDATQLFKVRNSWGPGWGLAGYFLMPYAYANNPNLAGDFRSASLAS